MDLDLFVDTSRKGISMAVSSQGSSDLYREIINPAAKGETLSKSLDEILEAAGAQLDDIKRVMVTLGPGSFSGLRTGIAFCQGISFASKRELFGVSTLKALACYAGVPGDSQVAVLQRARNGFWYLLVNGEESYIATEEALKKLQASEARTLVVDETAQKDEAIQAFANERGCKQISDVGLPLNGWSPLFAETKASLVQEANYIQPSYYEKV